MDSVVHRRRRTVRLIGAAIGLGGPDAGPALAPARLRAAGLAEALAKPDSETRWGAMLSVSGSAARPAGYAAFCARLATEVRDTLAAHEFPVVIGGDHSCAVGTWRGVAAALGGPPGLIWIDAHMDAHTRATTPSGHLHGMPLATLLGHGNGGNAVLLPEEVCLIGVRSFESEEQALLAKLGVRVFHIDEVHQRGLQGVMQEALTIATRSRHGFGVSLDVDAIDPQAAPGVNTPAVDGLAPEALEAALRQAAVTPGLRALELVEYNPDIDRDDRTAQLVTRALAAALSRTVDP